jgi:hypothetical protein
MNGNIKEPTSDDKLQVTVLAVGITQQVRDRAAPDHPVTSSENIPFDPSMHGIVQHENTGKLYYVLPRGPRLLSERINVRKDALIELTRGTDPVRVAGLLGPWLTSLSLLLNCNHRKVLIIGVTTCNGQAATQVARWFGAGAIIGLSDDNDALLAVPGLTIRAHLTYPIRIPKFQGIDIVLDFIGGETGVQILNQINNVPNGSLFSLLPAKELKYAPAWGPRGGDPFVLDANMMNTKNLQIVDPSLALWRVTTAKMREKLLAGLQLMERLETAPYEIVAKSMADVEKVWDEEDFKNSKKMLVLLPSKAGEKFGLQSDSLDSYMKSLF